MNVGHSFLYEDSQQTEGRKLVFRFFSHCSQCSADVCCQLNCSWIQNSKFQENVSNIIKLQPLCWFGVFSHDSQFLTLWPVEIYIFQKSNDFDSALKTSFRLLQSTLGSNISWPTKCPPPPQRNKYYLSSLQLHRFEKSINKTHNYAACFRNISTSPRMLPLVILVMMGTNGVLGLENGLARTPPMGWMSWERWTFISHVLPSF